VVIRMVDSSFNAVIVAEPASMLRRTTREAIVTTDQNSMMRRKPLAEMDDEVEKSGLFTSLGLGQSEHV
jgi:hypothetical protein